MTCSPFSWWFLQNGFIKFSIYLFTNKAEKIVDLLTKETKLCWGLCVESKSRASSQFTEMVLTCRTSPQLLQNPDWLSWLVRGSSGMQRPANPQAWSIIRRHSQECQIFFSSWSATQPFLCCGQGAPLSPPSPPAATCLSYSKSN